MFLAEMREHSSKDGMSYGSLVDCESQKIKRTVLSTTVAEFLRGLWIDLSGEDAEIHMRTDGKNLVTTARTIHSPEQKERSTRFPCCERKPVQEVFMILLTFQLRIVWQIV